MRKQKAPRHFSHGPRFGVDIITRRINSKEVRTEYYPRVEAPEFGSPASLDNYAAAFDQARTIAERIADARDEKEEIRRVMAAIPGITEREAHALIFGESVAEAA